MYNYRKMTQEQKNDTVRTRKINKLPLHQPFHHMDGTTKTYLITSANYEHKNIMANESRRNELQEKIFSLCKKTSSEIHCWCILSNHYHLLIKTELGQFSNSLTKLHWGTSVQWNKEDSTPGRKVWHSFSDRAIRNESHFWATVNYINSNPVKHGYVKKADQWSCSSIHDYLDNFGREKLIEIWNNHPLDDYGKGWDW
ncbi:MAG: transposase [Victivallales bacterium]